MRLGERFAEAVAKAADWHEGQVRKGTHVPYISHLLIVAGIVVQAGGDEDEAIAALLHDAIEDAGATREEIEEKFGERVAAIVWECTDATQEMKSEIPWRARKEGYIARLEATEDRGALLVSCADKLHNARSILIDLEAGQDVWERFNVSIPAEQLWYYRELVRVFGERLDRPRWLPEELVRTVERIGELVERGVETPG